MKVIIFCMLGLKTGINATKSGLWGHLTLKIRRNMDVTLKRHVLPPKHVI